jgi:arsenate reductase (thioredoxin)
MPDPAAVEGSDIEQWQAFRDTFRALEDRIKIFVALPVASLDRISLAHQVEAIGRMRPDEAGVMNITIYHNPDCGTSRNVLALIRNSGEEPKIIEYLKTPPTRDELVSLIDRMGVPVRDVLRRKGTPYDALGLDNPSLTDDALIDAMMAHPILINRPIVVTPDTVKLCRPSETVLDLLPQPQRGPFAKEDGEAVIDTHGNRIRGLHYE